MFSSFEWNKCSQLPAKGTNALLLLFVLGDTINFDQSWFSVGAWARRPIDRPSPHGCSMLADEAFRMPHLISDGEISEGACFHFGNECIISFVLFCDANFLSWENFFPEGSEWSCKIQTEVFAQEVWISTTLSHNSFLQDRFLGDKFPPHGISQKLS